MKTFFQRPSSVHTDEIQDLNGTLAYSRRIERIVVTAKDGSKFSITFRMTDGLRRINGNWLITLEHISMSIDLGNDEARSGLEAVNTVAANRGLWSTDLTGKALLLVRMEALFLAINRDLTHRLSCECRPHFPAARLRSHPRHPILKEAKAEYRQATIALPAQQDNKSVSESALGEA